MLDYNEFPAKNILCLDMKSFFASVEAVDRGLNPMETFLVVVANKASKGSVILASSPQMKKKYGIKTGNRLFDIPMDDEEILIVESRMALYVEAATQIIRILESFVPYEAIDVYSIDEAWICTDGTEKLFGDRWEIAKKIQEKIHYETSLPSCIGIGPNKFLAKVILDMEAKKTGIAECRYEDVAFKLWPQNLGEIWGIGPRIEKRLNKIGVFTVEDLARTPVSKLKKHFGIIGEQLYWHSWGIDLSPTIQSWNFEEERKSISTGITLMSDYNTADTEMIILELCEEIGLRLRKSGLVAKTIYLGIGYSKNINGKFGHAHTIDDFTCLSSRIFEECILIFRKYHYEQPVRKVYVSVSNLQAFDTLQLKMFNGNEQKNLQLAFAVDELKDKYGKDAILRGISLQENASARERANKIGGHKK